MRNNYFLKPIIFFCFTMALVIGNFSTGLSQNIFIYAPDGYTPIAKNIAPGSANNFIGMFVIGMPTGQSSTLTSVTFPTAGTFTSSDIKANGFKLWYSEYLYSNSNPIANATEIASTAAVSSGGNIIFSGLSKKVTGGVFLLSAEIAENAVMGHTLQISSLPLSNIVFSPGTNTGSTIQAMNVQTIGIPLPIVSISYYIPGSRNVSAGSSEITLAEFNIQIEDGDANFNSISVPTKGTYVPADFNVNGIKLWRKTSTEKTLLKSINAPISGGNIVISGLNEILEKEKYHELIITADLAPDAVSGHTFGLESFPKSNFVFSQLQLIKGTPQLPTGVLHTVAIPDITINSEHVPAGRISPGSFSNILYKLKINPVNAGAAITQIKFTTGGTYQLSDIAAKGFKIYKGDIGAYYSEELIASTEPVMSGETIAFDLPGYVVNEENEIYIYLTADVTSSATSGRTIFIEPVTNSNLSAVSGTITGSGKAGGLQTIIAPSINFTAAGPAAKTVSASTSVQLHTVKVDISNAPVTFNSASFSVSGSFVSSDFTNSDNIYLMYHKTPDLIAELDNYESVFIISKVSVMPASGGTLIFNYIPYDTWNGINPSIPVGSGYISVMARLSSSPVNGHTIQLTSSGIAAYTFGSGTKTGTIGTGGLQTIGTPGIFVSQVTTTASNISPHSSAVIYKSQVDVSAASAVLEDATFTTGGTYTSDEIYSFSLYLSNDLEFDNEDHYLGYAPFISPGEAMKFEYINPYELKTGTTYLLLVAHTTSYAEIGKTINITSTPLSSLTFASGTVTGSTMAAGGVQTFAAPSSVNLTYPVIAGSEIQAGSNDNVIYSFAIAPTGSNAVLSNVSLPVKGTFTSSDLREFSTFGLYYNTTNSFTGSMAVQYYQIGVNSGDAIEFDYLDFTINNGAKIYFFVTANISSTAIAGHTIQMGAVDPSAFTFAAGTATAAGPEGNSFEIIVPSAVLSSSIVSGSQIARGTKDNIIYQFTISPQNSNIMPSAVNLKTAGTFMDTDIEEFGFKLYYNNTNSFNGSKEISNIYKASSGDALDFIIFDELTINKGLKGYFFVTADVSLVATASHTLKIDAVNSSDITFIAGTATGAGTTGEEFEISITTGISNKSPEEEALIFPNPSRQNSIVTINTKNENLKLISIYHANGRLLKSMKVNDKIVTLEQLEKGIVFVVIQNMETKQTMSKRLVIE